MLPHSSLGNSWTGPPSTAPLPAQLGNTAVPTSEHRAVVDPKPAAQEGAEGETSQFQVLVLTSENFII